MIRLFFRIFLLVLFQSATLSVLSQKNIEAIESKLSKLDQNTPEYTSTLTLLAKEYAETDPEKALILAAKALQNVKDDSLKGQIYIAFSSAHSYMASYDTSTWYCFKALKAAEKYKDTVTLIDAYNNIGIDFMFQEEDERAIEYYEKVESLSRSFQDSLRLGHALNNLGIMASYSGDYDTELDYYNQASKIFQAINEKDGLANIFLNTATTYSTLKQFDRADEYLEKALELFKTLKFSSGIQNTIQSMAENELARGNDKKANKLAREALDIAKKNELAQDVIYTYELLEQISLATSNYKKAHEYLKKSKAKQQEVFTLEKSRQIEELETKYETAKKEAEIERLSLKNELQTANLARARNAQIAIGIGAIMTIIALAIFFILRNKKLKAEREAQELQVEALKKRFMELHSSPSELAVEMDMDELNKKLHTPLTEREFDALKLSIEGKSNPDISEELFISVSTVKFHLRNAYSKMGVGNRKEAFQFILKTS